MSEEELFSTILKSTYTTADFRRRLSLLKLFFEKKFFSGSDTLTVSDFLSNTDANESDKQFFLSQSGDFFDTFTKENVYPLLEGLEKLLKNSPTIMLFVPLHLPANEVSKLGNWFVQNLPNHTLIDLKVDPAAVGGCTFVWNGFLSDYSLNFHLAKHKEEIKSLINSYGQHS